MLAGEIETVKNKIVKDMGNKDAKVRRISTVMLVNLSHRNESRR